MDENAAIIESILREEAKLNGEPVEDNDSGWKTVSYPRRQRKNQHPSRVPPEFSTGDGVNDIFRPIDQYSEERRRRVVEAQRAALEAAGFTGGSKDFSGEDSGDDETSADVLGDGNITGTIDTTAPCRVKKPKKPKVSVAAAAAKIDADDLAAFLIDISASYESQEDIQLMRFADYFGRAFASVGSAQFPWMKMLKESGVAKMVDIPLSYVSEAVYKTSLDWLN